MQQSILLNLRGVNLQGANLTGAKVTDLQLSMASCDATTCYPDGRFRHQKWGLWQRLWPGRP
ncbi:MAG: pentapeptide repeat-containing protein [Prochlorotrichaceae cyanobacterium]